MRDFRVCKCWVCYDTLKILSILATSSKHLFFKVFSNILGKWSYFFASTRSLTKQKYIWSYLSLNYPIFYSRHYATQIFLKIYFRNSTHLQLWTKHLEQSKDIKQNWTGKWNFDNCFCIILTAITQVLFLEGRLGTRMYLRPVLIFS